MTGYTKLFNSILMSSIWEENSETRIVWVTLLALADQYGHVDGTIKSLARVARVSQTACIHAVTCFLAPDPEDRSGVDNGRRLRVDTGGWAIVNHALYRERMSVEERRERDKIRKRELRASAPRPQVSELVRDVSQADQKQIRSDQKQEGEQSALPLKTRSTPLVARRRKDAAWEGPRVYVPQRLHSDFIGLRNHPGAENELLGWYAEVSEAWTTGSRAHMSPGGDMFQFWKARYSEQWPPTTTAKAKLEAWQPR